jgi:hypothetical protein
MDTKQNFEDDSILQLTELQLAAIASSRKDIEEGLIIDHSTLKKEVKIWLKER